VDLFILAFCFENAQIADHLEPNLFEVKILTENALKAYLPAG